MKPSICLASLALAISLASSSANGQSEGEGDTFIGQSAVVGSWSFRSARYRQDSCVMSGSMHIRPTDQPSVFNCSFTAIEECRGQDKWVVEQTCKAAHRDGQLSIKSTIVNFLEAREFTDSYRPDHFALNVVNRELMTGSLVSAITAPIEFRRDADNVS